MSSIKSCTLCSQIFERPQIWWTERCSGKFFGCPDHFISLTRQFHYGTIGRDVVGKQESNSIPMNHGTKQGCVLTQRLFMLFLTFLLTILHQQIDDGVYIRSRSDGNLSNLARLRARTKTRTKYITELLFADDIALMAHNPAKMHQMVIVFSKTTNKLGLQINIEKTKMMYQPSPPTLTPVHQ